MTPDAGSPLRLLGVDYLHLKLANGDDLYVTRYGRPFLDHLRPENWFEKEWFEQSREKLLGTSTVYKVRTKPVAGRAKDLVVKWCRVGEVVPLDTLTLNKFAEAEFNSPYEEFALVMELRANRTGRLVLTHRPLAIYVPAERLKLWQTGRSKSKIAQKKARHRDVELDIYRQYILIYEWVKGLSIAELFDAGGLPGADRAALTAAFMQRATDDLARKGYRVLDMKPAHIIVRPRPDGSLSRDRAGETPFALVDFELLMRTPAHEEAVQAQRRAEYLKRQRDRFIRPKGEHFPAHLHSMRICGVDYVWGHTESTQGFLWVVGNDPTLFDYFQPERWRRTPRQRLSQSNEVYHTLTKDKINLVWKVSQVGARPEFGSETPVPPAIAAHGWNSPFEEFGIALELARRGIPTVYPRAIYMTGQEAANPEDSLDNRRYHSHAHILTPDGTPVLRADHNYITIWGFWNGLDEFLAHRDAEYCKGLNGRQAVLQGWISEAELEALMAKVARVLAGIGLEDLNPKATHFLLTLNPSGQLLRDSDGTPAVRLCNFELIRRQDGEPLFSDGPL